MQIQQTKLTKVIEYWPRTEIISESDVISMVEFSIGTASAKFSSTKRKGQKERRSSYPARFLLLSHRAHTTCKKYKCRKGTKTLPSLKRISTNNLSVGTRRLSGFSCIFAACFNLDHMFKIRIESKAHILANNKYLSANGPTHTCAALRAAAADQLSCLRSTYLFCSSESDANSRRLCPVPRLPLVLCVFCPPAAGPRAGGLNLEGRLGSFFRNCSL